MRSSSAAQRHARDAAAFISYSHADEATALVLSEQLRHRGIDTFIDKHSLRNGDRWLDRLQQALTECSAFVVLVGTEGVQRWVGAEVGVALGRHLAPHDEDERLPIHPVLLGDTAPEALPPFLALFQSERWDGRSDLPSTFIDTLAERRLRLDDKVRFEGCPYQGLASFRREHAQLFFGRWRETLEAIAGLGDQQQRAPDQRAGGNGAGYRRWLQVEGGSGSGKSSLVAAGMLPLVERGALWPRTGLAQWRVIGPLMPGQRPLERLAEALEHAFQPEAAKRDLLARHRQLASGPRALSLYLRGLVPPGESAGHLLVVDQFEELFTLADEAERAAFDAALAHALQDPDCPLFLASTVRSDFLDRIELLPQLAAIYNARCQRYLLGAVTREGLREAIELPAKLAGLDVSEVTAAILRDAEGESGALPLVENALRLLWSERRGTKINGALYESRGGLAGMLSGAADALLARIAADVPKHKRGEQAALELLLALTRYSPDGRHTRRRITRAEAIQAAGNGDDALGERVLAWLAGQRDPERPSHAPGETLRLVTTGTEAMPDGGEAAYVDLIHETLLRARREGGVVERGPAARANEPYWPLLSDYIETHRDRDMLRQRLAWQVERWQQGSRLASWRHLAGWGDLLDYRRLRVAKRSNPGRYVSVSWRLRGVQSTLIGAVVLVLGESLVWATANNLPLSYVFVQPLWMLGWTPIPQTVAIPPPAGGRFEMGCKPGRDDGPGLDCKRGSFGQALPGPRWVDLPRVCDMGKFEVTFFEYDRYVWATGGKGFSGERYPPDSGWGRGRRPVINVSWNDAQAYVAWLSQRQPGAGWRLPSEAEWEYAARANGNGPYPWGRESPKGRANYFESGVGKTLPVGSFESYGGLHDVAGNVWEWVVDKVEDERPSRVLRGGSWYVDAGNLRAADRYGVHPDDRDPNIGFRVCRWSPIEKPSAGALTAEPPKR